MSIFELEIFLQTLENNLSWQGRIKDRRGPGLGLQWSPFSIAMAEPFSKWELSTQAHIQTLGLQIEGTLGT